MRWLLLASLGAAIGRFRRDRRLRRNEQDLRMLPDHVLRDMGIGRSEILSSMRFGRGAAPHERDAPVIARFRTFKARPKT